MERIKDFIKKYEIKIVLILGFLLVAGLSFEVGFIQGKKIENVPLIVEKAPQSSKNKPESSQNQKSVTDTNYAKSSLESSSKTLPKNCTYVGSKNSNKYHLPTCRWAKQIKPENIVCFKSAEDAKSKNYLPDKNCIK